MAQPRRFPPPWTVEELDACFVVIDSAVRGREWAAISGEVADER